MSLLKSDKHCHGPWSVSVWIRYKHSNYSIYKNASSQVGISILDVLVIKRIIGVAIFKPRASIYIFLRA